MLRIEVSEELIVDIARYKNPIRVVRRFSAWSTIPNIESRILEDWRLTYLVNKTGCWSAKRKSRLINSPFPDMQERQEDSHCSLDSRKQRGH